MKKIISMIFVILVVICTFANAQENVCEHDIWTLNCLGIKTYCPECQDSAELTGTKTCTTCSGKKQIKCNYCNGKGRKSCSYCNGTGRFLGSKCNYCGGKLSLGCIDCLSSGYRYCPSCKGAGADLILSDECLKCGSTPQCCEYYAFHNCECPICSQDAYEKFDYKKAVRNANKFIGNLYQVSGVVESVSKLDDLDTYELRIKNTSLLSKQYYNILYKKSDPAPVVLVGDKITLYGVFTDVNNDMEPCLVSAYSVLI